MGPISRGSLIMPLVCSRHAGARPKRPRCSRLTSRPSTNLQPFMQDGREPDKPSPVANIIKFGSGPPDFGRFCGRKRAVVPHTRFQPPHKDPPPKGGQGWTARNPDPQRRLFWFSSRLILDVRSWWNGFDQGLSPAHKLVTDNQSSEPRGLSTG